MTTQLISLSHIINELFGTWVRSIDESLSVWPAVNFDGAVWLLFGYDFSDEIGPVLYNDLAIPNEKINREIEHILQAKRESKIQLVLTGIPVEQWRQGYSEHPRIPINGDLPNISLTMNADQQVICAVYNKPFWRSCKGEKQHPIRLKIDEQGLAATSIPLDPWRKYISHAQPIPNEKK